MYLDFDFLWPYNLPQRRSSTTKLWIGYVMLRSHTGDHLGTYTRVQVISNLSEFVKKRWESVVI